MTGSFLETLIRCSESEPGRVFAQLYESGSWTEVGYGTLLSLAFRFRRAFLDAGLRRGEVVFIILRHGVDPYAAFVGAMLAGGVPSFLPYPNGKHDHGLYWAQHRKLFARVRPRLILVYDELAEAVADCAAATGAVVLVASAAAAAAPLDGPVTTASEYVALLQHSSGTTGLKKGVALSYGAITAQLEAYAGALGLEDGRSIRVASWLPLYHDMGLIACFLLPLYLGGSVIAIDPFVWVGEPALLLAAIERHGATHCWLPNFAFLHLARGVPRKARYDLSSIRAIVSCSEQCKPEAFSRFLARFGEWGVGRSELLTCYAMAETVFAVSQSDPGAPPRSVEVSRAAVERLGPVELPTDEADAVSLLSNGPPIAGCEVGILNGDTLAGERTFGEICVKAPFLFSGYDRNPEATEAAFHAAWYRTGDIGFVDGGEVFVAGRLKDVIIVNGKNVFAHDVEACLAGIAGLKPGRVVALGVYKEFIGSEQLVVVAETDGSARNETEIASAVNRAVLEEIGIPCSDVRIVAPGWLVKTTSGKVSRSENQARYLHLVQRT